ncbi:MAG: DNA-directed RNA polymerase subunit delta [Bacillota bacterium]|jgi:DNA-directed RNA polymerase subunit delta|nr:DNA-directed RNA polymerase subunit delta [Bacillota bacterium]
MMYGEGWEEKTTILNFVYELFKTGGQPLHYSLLIEEVAKRFLDREEDLVRAKARFYTWLNLDPRFVYLGQGQWGLRSWIPEKGGRRVPLLSLMHKTLEYDDGSPRIPGREQPDELFPAHEMLMEKEEPVSDDYLP